MWGHTPCKTNTWEFRFQTQLRPHKLNFIMLNWPALILATTYIVLQLPTQQETELLLWLPVQTYDCCIPILAPWTSEHLKCPPFPREPPPKTCWKQVNKDGQAVRTQSASACQNFSLLLLHSNLKMLSLKFSFKLLATMLLPIWRFLYTLFALLTNHGNI